MSTFCFFFHSVNTLCVFSSTILVPGRDERLARSMAAARLRVRVGAKMREGEAETEAEAEAEAEGND